jgi:hypothetical protein
MSVEQQELVAQLADLINQLVDMRVEEITKPLKAELQLVKSLQSEWVDTKEALKITGIKKAQTLKAERERPGTVIIFKFEGSMCNTPRYLRASLIAYNDKKTKRRITGYPLRP